MESAREARRVYSTGSFLRYILSVMGRWQDPSLLGIIWCWRLQLHLSCSTQDRGGRVQGRMGRYGGTVSSGCSALRFDLVWHCMEQGLEQVYRFMDIGSRSCPIYNTLPVHGRGCVSESNLIRTSTAPQGSISCPREV